MTAQAQYSDGYWWSKDNLRLHYRDYAGGEGRPPIICIPGLIRNARDYDQLARRLSPAWRVICVNLRGRGESAYAKDSLTYAPLTYMQDIDALFDHLGITRFIAFGTSVGGIVTMLLASTQRARIIAALLNDVGPDPQPNGAERIKAHLPKAAGWPTWVHAARALAEQFTSAHPGFALVNWLEQAKLLFRLTAQGRIVPDYDPKIAEPFATPATEFDMWPAFLALDGAAVLVIRGALSDMLTATVAAKMIDQLPRSRLVTIAYTGHAPTLNEPETLAAIDDLLATIDP